MSPRTVILVVDADLDGAEHLAADLRSLLAGMADVVVVGDAEAAVDVGRSTRAQGGIVPIAFVESDIGDQSGVETLVALSRDPDLAATRTVLLTAKPSLRGVEAALQRGAVHAMITKPWTRHGLGDMLDAHLATYLLQHAPERLDEFDTLLDADDHRLALARIEHERGGTDSAPSTPHLLLDRTVTDDEIERRMVELLDRTLGHPPRIRVAPGTILIEQDEDVGGIYVVLDGTVRLTSRTRTGERILHERSTGAIIGLLSLAEHRRAEQRCRAVTDVRAIPVTLDQLASALDASPELASLLMRVLIASLAKRLRRSDELQVELDQSLAELSAARAQLVASARLTALGEMAAGMAHEINNPAAALVRAVEHALADLAAVLDDPGLVELVEARLESTAEPTSQYRSRRRELTEAVGDRQLADRLLQIGVKDRAEAIALGSASPSELDRLEAAARLGRSLRNAANAAERIASLVDSLRAYARGDAAGTGMVDGVDVADGVDSALRLVAHRLGDIQVERDYEAVPPITAKPGPLQQVWTNLLANAIEALAGQGRMEIRVGPVGPDRVRVSVTDDGPGIDESLREKIFEPRFTTKDGRVQYGLGLGLSISRGIVADHGGTIDVDSRPGHTVFTVDLPVEPSVGHDREYQSDHQGEQRHHA